MTWMKGWAKPTGPGKLFDHTWITTADGSGCWRCAGGSENYYCTNCIKDGHYVPPSDDDGQSRLICEGDGDVAKAKCIAGELTYIIGDWPQYAGIVYGINGVCHQMANRILASTKAWVTSPWDGANGCTLSVLNYGHYGTRASVSNLSPLVAAAAVVNWGGMMTLCQIDPQWWHLLIAGDQAADLMDQVRNLVSSAPVLSSDVATQMDDQTNRHMAEVKLTLDHAAHGQVDEKQLERLIDLYRVYHTPTKDVVQMAGLSASEAEVLAESLDGPTVAAEINAAHKVQVEKVANLLTLEEFETIFRQTPDEALQWDLIDMSVFAGTQSADTL